jgi:hypothetical protein
MGEVLELRQYSLRPGQRDVLIELFDREFVALFERAAEPALAWFSTEYAENDFPTLPVRTDVHAFVWFARFDSVEALDRHPAWRPPAVTVHRLRLAPTGRSLLR